MKKTISLVLLIIFGGCNLLFSQFSIYTAPVGTIVNDLDIDNSNSLLVATDAGFLIFDGSNWTTYDITDGLPDNDIKCIASTQNKVYVGTANKGMAYLSGSVWTLDNLNTSTSYGYISFIFAKQNGDKYLGTDNGKVFKLLNGQTTPALKNYGTLGRITCIEETANNVVLATLSTNAIMLDFSGYLVPINANSSSLPSNNIICAIENKSISYDGTDAGLYMVNFNIGPPPAVTTLTSSNSGMPSNVIQALEVHNSRLFVGTDNGLAIVDINDNSWTDIITNTWTVYNTTNSNIPGNNVIELTIDSNGKVWIATSDGSISSFIPASISKISESPIPLKITPNPFINKTKIIFSSKDKKEKVIRIYDALGRELQQMSLTASSNGIYETTVDLNTLPIGMYYCKVDGYNKAIKMLKIK